MKRLWEFLRPKSLSPLCRSGQGGNEMNLTLTTSLRASTLLSRACQQSLFSTKPRFLPTIAEKEAEIFANEKKRKKRRKYFHQCPSCGSQVSSKKFESHLHFCARDLVPKGSWPGVHAAADHARVLEQQVRHDVIHLRFVEKLSVSTTATTLNLTEKRIQRVVRMHSKSMPLVIDPPSSDIINVLYEDEDILAINKPPRITHHPAHRWEGGSLVRNMFFFS